MTRAWLAAGVHMAWVGDDLVILDVRSDAYSCIVDGGRHIRPVPQCADAVALPEDLIEDLAAAGVIAEGRPVDRRRRTKPPTRSTAWRHPASFGSVLRAGLSSLEAGLRFRRLPLHALVRPEALRGPSGPDRLRDPQQVETAFLAALPWIPAQGQCLQRAFALRRLLARNGVHADWVFGVRTWPFLAHCWLQIDDLLLADDLDRVRGFTPILTT